MGTWAIQKSFHLSRKLTLLSLSLSPSLSPSLPPSLLSLSLSPFSLSLFLSLSLPHLLIPRCPCAANWWPWVRYQRGGWAQGCTSGRGEGHPWNWTVQKLKKWRTVTLKSANDKEYRPHQSCYNMHTRIFLIPLLFDFNFITQLLNLSTHVQQCSRNRPT